MLLVQQKEMMFPNCDLSRACASSTTLTTASSSSSSDDFLANLLKLACSYCDAEENISTQVNNNTRGGSSDESNQAARIYSLGLVFYRLFSGEEERRPAEEKLEEEGKKQCSEKKTETDDDDDLSQELFEDLEPLPFDQAVLPNIALDGADFEKISILDDFGLGGDNYIIDDTTTFPSQNRGKRRTQNNNVSSVSVSVEILKAKGFPVALCDLIANMLDCGNGDLSGEDAYQKISDVRDDLQLMLDKPAIYLHDQDMGKLSTTGIQFGETMFGRNSELSSMRDVYSHATSFGEMVIISGPSGSGKSLLAYEFGKFVLSKGGIFLSGKFDQLQQGKPFSALASAFNQYCGMLLQSSNLAPTKEQLATKVNTVLGSDTYHLMKLIPNLETILVGEMNMNDINHDVGCSDAQKRLQYLLCRFVDIISSLFSAPVTLFLDDLQWADAASIAAVNQLLLTGDPSSQTRRLFFLGCCREGEIENSNNSLWKTGFNVDLLARSTKLKLDYMTEETLNRMVSETLHLFPRLTRVLSNIIYHKTKGNPFFVSRLMLSLSKQGLLRPSLSRRRWEWDIEKIQREKLPDDVAEFLANSINVLSQDVKSALRVLSCFGASSNVSFIKTMEGALNMNLIDKLDVSVNEGLLDKIDDQYRFSHDRIQEAVYRTIDGRDRSSISRMEWL